MELDWFHASETREGLSLRITASSGAAIIVSKLNMKLLASALDPEFKRV